MAAQNQAEWIRKYRFDINGMKRINDAMMDEANRKDLEHKVAMSKLSEKFEASKQVAEDS